MVQDLWIIYEVVVPFHPTVPNPYVILGEIPSSAKWFTVLDLKDTFFCTPLAEESQYLFAFKWEAPGEKHQQMTWIALPQGFRDSPHLFGQALSWDLLDLDLLNFLVNRGYKVSHAKAQMVKTKITHLGVHITHGSRKLCWDQVQGILQVPSPTT